VGRTSRFIKSAKSILQSIKEGRTSSNWLDMYEPFSRGRCFVCGERLYVRDILKTGSGIEYEFRCGHGLTIITLDEAQSGGEGYSNSKVGINLSGEHEVKIDKGGSDPGKESDELAVAKLFSHYIKPQLEIFTHDVEASPYDVVAKAKNGGATEYFQITRLQDNQFWSKLNKTNQVSAALPRIEELVRNAVLRKAKYSPTEKSKITLLIDARPGVMEEISTQVKISLETLLKASGFKEIWLTGSARELIQRIL
jgi:hypothetical protein